MSARAAIVHDWYVAEAGSERTALELLRLLPVAPLYTSFFEPSLFGGGVPAVRARPWLLNRVPGARRRYRSFLPLYPVYFGRLDLREFDLVVSSSVAFAHAVRTRASAQHVSYVYTPLRYAWDLDGYLEGSSLPLPSRIGARAIRPWLRRWDRSAVRRATTLIAISEAVRERMRRYWDRDAEVIYPPVDVDSIQPSAQDDGFLLVASRLLSYRRIDLAVQAATKLGRDLIVVGDGPERRSLERVAGRTVRFFGRVDRLQLNDLFARCHAYVVPGIEDFGIAPVEAMAAGKPVVGFRAGGVAETVLDGETGALFEHPTLDAIVEAIERVDAAAFDRARIRLRAEEYSTLRFNARFVELFRRLGVDPTLYRS